MNDRSVGHLGTIVQSFAVFVAISILLGRIYFLTYLETLGIPTSEARLNVVDYSVLSPDVTILGVGLALLSTVFLWAYKFPTSSTGWRSTRIVIGIVLSIMGILLGRADFLHALHSGFFGFALLLALALSAAGGLTFASGITSSDSSRNSGNDSGEPFDNIRTFIPIVLITFIGLSLVLVALTYSVRIGRLDARNTLLDAQQANIEFTSLGAPNGLPYESDTCQNDSSSCAFKVILIGDEFIYLRPVDSGPSPEEQRLYAFPVKDIASIAYFTEGNPQ